MNDSVLYLHCPRCGRISEVVCEGRHLVCVECGWQFSPEVCARYLAGDGAAAGSGISPSTPGPSPDAPWREAPCLPSVDPVG